MTQRTCTLFGIPNCDSVRKGRRLLSSAGFEVRFHDVREEGLEEKQIRSWLIQVPADTLLNTRSTTWRNLEESEKSDLSAEKTVALLIAHPSLLKRPVVDFGNAITVGVPALQAHLSTVET